MSKYLVKPVAQKAISKQAKFISRDGILRSKAFVDHIYSKFELLAKNPSIGRNVSHIRSNLCVWPDRKYKTYIYYTPYDDNIVIEQVIGMRQDQSKAFGK